MTLHFFGPTPDEQFNEIIRVSRRVAGEIPPLEIALAGTGFFPAPSKPRIIWLGIENPDRKLAFLVQLLRRYLRKRGFEIEKRPFRAHATFGRVKRSHRDVMKGGGFPEIPSMKETAWRTIGEMIFYESELRPSGSVYHVLETFPLGGKTQAPA